MRTSPNVIITGTPGVGKTVHCEQLAQDIGLKHLSINQVAKDRGCFDEYDEELKTWVVDEDKVRFSSAHDISVMAPFDTCVYITNHLRHECPESQNANPFESLAPGCPRR
jgi:broad-specificity NMP kinase